MIYTSYTSSSPSSFSFSWLRPGNTNHERYTLSYVSPPISDTGEPPISTNHAILSRMTSRNWRELSTTQKLLDNRFASTSEHISLRYAYNKIPLYIFSTFKLFIIRTYSAGRHKSHPSRQDPPRQIHGRLRCRTQHPRL